MMILIIMGLVVRMRAEVAKVGTLFMIVFNFFQSFICVSFAISLTNLDSTNS